MQDHVREHTAGTREIMRRGEETGWFEILISISNITQVNDTTIDARRARMIEAINTCCEVTSSYAARRLLFVQRAYLTYEC